MFEPDLISSRKKLIICFCSTVALVVLLVASVVKMSQANVLDTQCKVHKNYGSL